MKKIFSLSIQPINLDLGLLFIRVIVGLLMAFYGYSKLVNFDAMAASDFWAKNVSFLGFTGKVPLALTVFAEFFCSLLLLVGLLTRLSLVPLIICMCYIFMITAEMKIISTGENGTAVNDGFVYFMIYLGLFFTGPGKYSLDHMISKKR